MSPQLIEAMRLSLECNEQVILLLNRRGYQPTIHCSECGTTLMCPHCDRALVYHKDDQSVKCHLCGYSIPVPNVCPSCKSPSLKGMGFGTQRLAEMVSELFPDKKSFAWMPTRQPVRMRTVIYWHNLAGMKRISCLVLK